MCLSICVKFKRKGLPRDVPEAYTGRLIVCPLNRALSHGENNLNCTIHQWKGEEYEAFVYDWRHYGSGENDSVPYIDRKAYGMSFARTCPLLTIKAERENLML